MDQGSRIQPNASTHWTIRRVSRVSERPITIALYDDTSLHCRLVQICRQFGLRSWPIPRADEARAGRLRRRRIEVVTGQLRASKASEQGNTFIILTFLYFSTIFVFQFKCIGIAVAHFKDRKQTETGGQGRTASASKESRSAASQDIPPSGYRPIDAVAGSGWIQAQFWSRNEEDGRTGWDIGGAAAVGWECISCRTWSWQPWQSRSPSSGAAPGGSIDALQGRAAT